MQCLCMVVMLFIIDYLLCVGKGGEVVLLLRCMVVMLFVIVDYYLLCVGKGGVVVLLHFRFLCYTHMGLLLFLRFMALRA